MKQKKKKNEVKCNKIERKHYTFNQLNRETFNFNAFTYNKPLFRFR